MQNIAIVLLTCEIEHLEEWYLHHKSYGFKNFFVYIDTKVVKDLNKLNRNLISEIKNIKTLNTDSRVDVDMQNTLYTGFCYKHSYFDYVLFIDSDEYYQSKTNNIQEDIVILKNKYGDFDAFGLCWRLYGANPPFENRVSIDQYKQWCPAPHIKSLVNPKAVHYFPTPHGVVLKPNSKPYTSENGIVYDFHKLSRHSSKDVWIKHIRFRSKSEWSTKFNRSGWYSKIIWYKKYKQHLSEDEIYNQYNLRCLPIGALQEDHDNKKNN
jgi:hypothetical protein